MKPETIAETHRRWGGESCELPKHVDGVEREIRRSSEQNLARSANPKKTSTASSRSLEWDQQRRRRYVRESFEWTLDMAVLEVETLISN